MGRFILHHDGKFLEWSTIVDAPITNGMNLKDFKKHYQAEYGRSSMFELESRIKRAVEKGTSSMIDDSFDEVIECNRAGLNETCLTKEQIVEFYFNNQDPEAELPEGTKPWAEDEE